MGKNPVHRTRHLTHVSTRLPNLGRLPVVIRSAVHIPFSPMTVDPTENPDPRVIDEAVSKARWPADSLAVAGKLLLIT
jgi:hypothetical protein